nr:unnamed protein product [Callosobruchus analis]
MNILVSILLLGALTQVSFVESSSSKRVVCYQGTWSVYRPANGTYGASNIDPFLCTHLIYSFIGLHANGSIRILDPHLDVTRKNFEQFVALSKKNPKLKVMVAIGGWNEGSVNYSKVVTDPKLRATFVQNVVTFLKTYGFHGFDLDWEYPADRGGLPSDKENFSLLIKELKAAFKEGGYILSAGVRALGSKADISYEVPELNKYLDFITIMTYDYHIASENVTGHVSPLYRVSADRTEEERHLNINASIHEWIERGASPENINLGIPFYGRAYTLADPSKTGLGAPVSKPGIAGPYTQEAGTIGYHEVVERLASGDWTYVFDEQQAAPHVYSGDQWMAYLDVSAIEKRVS